MRRRLLPFSLPLTSLPAPFLVGRGRLRKLVSAEGLAFALFDLLLERADGVYGEPLEHTLGDEERDLPDTETRPRDE